MDYVGSLPALAGIMALSVISPGPNFVIVSSTAMRASRIAGLAAGLGLAGASLTWTVFAISGLGLLLSHAAWVYEGVRIIGAFYLIYIGVKMIVGARKPLNLSGTARQPKPWEAMKRAYLVSMGNPKSIAFYGSIFALMVPPDAPSWFYAATVAIAGAISAGWYCSLAFMFSKPAVRRGFARVKTAIESVMGICLVALGGRLLIEA